MPLAKIKQQISHLPLLLDDLLATLGNCVLPVFNSDSFIQVNSCLWLKGLKKMWGLADAYERNE